MRLHIRNQLILWAAVAQHFTWALALCFSPDPCKVTSIAGICTSGGRWGAVALFSLVSTLAVCGLVRPRQTPRGMLLMLPQQVLLMWSAAVAAWCIGNGQFADGAVYSRAFIGTDQELHIVLAALHTIAVLEFHARWWPDRASTWMLTW